MKFLLEPECFFYDYHRNTVRVYLFVYGTSNAALIDSTPVKGLFTSVDWLVPAAFDSAATTSWNLVIGAPSGSPAVNASALAFGSYASGTVAAGVGTIPNGAIYRLAVPEASTSVLP